MPISPESVREPFWSMGLEEVFAALDSSAQGLKDEEAAARLSLFGSNSIKERIRLTKTRIILNQFKSPLILVLLAAGIITVFLGERLEAAVIFAAVFLNSILGFWQENKAETALDLLRGYIRTRSRVRRGGKEREIDSSELVPGDVVRVSRGDRIPADARLFFSKDLEADEAVLTGESLPAEKKSVSLPSAIALVERSNMVFSGTLAVQGFGDAIITATGSDTEFGKIAGLVAQKERDPTPLQRAILRFTVFSGAVLGVLTFLLFGLGLYYHYGLFEMFLIAVAVAVSAVPEGLPVALTVILAVGVERLSSRKGIVRRLLAAETLGSTSLILTDKTGTLTEARMEIGEVIPYGAPGEEKKRILLSRALLNSDVVVENPEETFENWRIAGVALETALARGAAQRGVLLPELRSQSQILDRLPFSSTNKFSATIARVDSGTRLNLFGAPEIILVYTLLPEAERQEILRLVEQLAYAGGRVLAVASREVVVDHQDILHNRLFQGLEFHGLIVFHDPLRPHVAETLRTAAQAGVKTIIVTGDHRGTAEAVARELGLIDGKGAVLTGDDLNYLKKEELLARSGQVSVYARVTPEQKLMLVKLYKEKGEVVAVTGDGVNDAPALEAADIGVAVGSGTDVAKGAADLVILDDDFTTIISAIEEGRRILDNVRKVIVYLLSDSLDELLLIGGALLAGIALPLNALQILFVNFFSDSFPAVALAFEKGVDEFGARPRKLEKNLFDKELKLLILVIGVLTSFLLFFLYYFLLRFGFSEDTVRTFIFASFATYTLFITFSIRSLKRSIFSYNPFSNFYLVGGVAIGIFLTALAIYTPALQKILGTVPLYPAWVLAVAGVGVLNVSAVELGKWLLRKN